MQLWVPNEVPMYPLQSGCGGSLGYFEVRSWFPPRAGAVLIFQQAEQVAGAEGRFVWSGNLNLLFLQIGGPFCGCLQHGSLTTQGLHELLAPLISGNIQMVSKRSPASSFMLPSVIALTCSSCRLRDVPSKCRPRSCQQHRRQLSLRLAVSTPSSSTPPTIH